MLKPPIRQLAILLYAVNFLLLTAYVCGTFFVVLNPYIYRLINLDGEASLPAWFSASQLLLTGVVFAAAAYRREHKVAGPVFLAVCATAFIFLSADEAASIHEKITVVFKDVEFLPRFSGDHGIWIPLYLLAGSVFLVVTGKTWLRLWRSNRNGATVFFLGIGLFAFGAVVLEIISYGELREIANRRYYAYQVLLEEAFELAGVTTILLGAIGMCFGRGAPKQ